jgi:hypothetical protein
MLEDYLFVKNTRYLLWGFGGVVLLLLVYHAGFVAGEHVHRTGMPGERGGGPLNGFMPKEAFIAGHGAVGAVATVTLPTFTMLTRGGYTQLVETSSSTVFTGGSADDLKQGVVVIVIGDPHESDTEPDLDARIVRLLPPPPTK